MSAVECFAGVAARLLPALRDADDGPAPRSTSIPARFVQGFLPGDLDPRTGVEEVLNSQRPRLGRGLLPGLRLGDVRPDRQRPRRDRAAAVGQAGRERRRRAASRASRRARLGEDGRDRASPAAVVPAPDRRRRLGPGAAFIVIALAPARVVGDRRVPRLAARPARRRRRRRARTRGVGAAGRPVRVRAAADPDRLRVRGALSATSCPASGPSSRPWRRPRSRSPTAGGRSATSGSGRCASRYARLRVGLLRLAVPPPRAGAAIKPPGG